VMAAPEMELSIEGICVTYGKTIRALREVALELHKGEIVAVLGANGAGKTTLLKTICGLLKPTAGSIKYRGREISGMSANKNVRLGIAYVPEGRWMVPHFSVKENLQSGGYIVKGKEKLKEQMEYVFKVFPILRERYNQTAGTLSGGEQQMLAIGRALMSKPNLLLLDEPSLGLAPILVDQVMELVKMINETSGMSVILVEQNAFIALETAKRAYILENGEITMNGYAEVLIQNPELKEKYLGG
jgi:branched-chain amino acid transport system ATP-binding protein